jgi:hypothetical protein
MEKQFELGFLLHLLVVKPCGKEPFSNPNLRLRLFAFPLYNN